MKFSVLLVVLILCKLNMLSQSNIFGFNNNWRYLDNDTRPTNWNLTTFNDASWANGNGEFGYGDGDETTIVNAGCLPVSSCNTKYITTLFRKTFNLSNPNLYSSFTFKFKRDDGIVVYINGVEKYRENLPGLPTIIDNTTLATAAASDDGTTIFNVALLTSDFVTGNNTIAVEIHQSSNNSSDISFDGSLVGNDLFSAGLNRDAYLQRGNQNQITIRWRTNANENSKVIYGNAFGSYTSTVTDNTLTTEHIVTLTGLSTDTKYYYSIGNTTNMGAPDSLKFFTTSPSTSTTRKVRIAAFGDCGRNNATYQDQNLIRYRNYLQTNNIDAPDAWILLGDNAYSSGTETEYSNNFFNIYGPNILKNHKLYPAPGNHDYGNNVANKTLRTLPYFNIFTTPQNAECGGVASNKPNYYSFDVGQIHFLSLDSWGIESDNTNMGTNNNVTALKNWITADLAANTSKWIVAYWHHPPYTKSSHNSDNEQELVDIRTNFIEFLETKGVDLIINGHSHAYERSYYLKGFKTSWTTFNSSVHAVNTSSATYDNSSTCPYVYKQANNNHGTVYVVAGSTGASGGINADFANYAMPFAVNDGGTFYFEVEDNRLDAKMIRMDGTIFDKFTMLKETNKNTQVNIAINNPATFTASWPGTYLWPNASTNQTFTITPTSTGITSYIVTDNIGCLADTFRLNALPTLAINLVNFNVTNTNYTAQISFKVSGSLNAKHYILEKSTDGINYIAINIFNVNANNSYAFTDAAIPNSNYYYRVNLINLNNSQQVLGTKLININNATSAITIQSLNNGVVVLNYNNPTLQKGNFKLSQINGSAIFNQSLAAQYNTSNRFPLKAGVYIATLKTYNKTITKRFIVN